MQKYIFIILLAGLLMTACNKNGKPTNKFPTDITVQIKIKDTTTIDTLRLFVWNAIQVEEVAKVAVSKTKDLQTAAFSFKKIDKGMYYVGESLRDLKPILLGTEKMISLEGNSTKMSELQIIESDLNKAYAKLLKSISSKNQYFMDLLTEYSRDPNNEEQRLKAKKKMEIEDKDKISTLDSLKAKNSELARIMAFNIFQSYQNNGKAGQTEGTYFAESFFEYVDFKDSVYSNLPFYYENIKNYAMALTQMGLTSKQQQTYLDSLLAKVPETNRNYKPTLVGCMLGVMGKNNPLFLRYSALYTQKYKGDYALLDKFVSQQTIKLKGAAGVGTAAPALKAPSPDGTIKSLEQMRGKYVLIDFWASWCGPCRRENPNVVRLYNKYKSKGFDILGVSLDTKKASWVGAIAKDGLTWTHISDLKGWSSALSKPYGVRGIPYTVLVDKQGNVIAKQLRGATLEAKLKEIFGF